MVVPGELRKTIETELAWKHTKCGDDAPKTDKNGHLEAIKEL